MTKLDNEPNEVTKMGNVDKNDSNVQDLLSELKAIDLNGNQFSLGPWQEFKVVEVEKSLEDLSADVEKYTKLIEEKKQKRKLEIDEFNISNLDCIEDKKKQQEMMKEIESLKLNQQIICQNSNAFNMTCKFDDSYVDDYICRTDDVEINAGNMMIDQVIGKHVQHRRHSDVKELIIETLKMFYLSKDFFRVFPNLETLRIQKTSVKHMNVGDFSGAKSVKYLYLIENKIKSIDDNVFQGNYKLELINLDSNFIKEISSDSFKGPLKLKTLSLRNNLIRELHVDTFKDLINLKTLILSSNQLKSLDGKLFQNNFNLYKLLLNDNQLISIGEDLLVYANNLKIVDLSNNQCIDKISKGTDFDNISDEIKNKCKHSKDCVTRPNLN